ncbi:unnamed protein product [Closterium sp. Yama58-4]|nr:unnamed protein product [Closterium sp. Yama58-4]
MPLFSCSDLHFATLFPFHILSPSPSYPSPSPLAFLSHFSSPPFPSPFHSLPHGPTSHPLLPHPPTPQVALLVAFAKDEVDRAWPRLLHPAPSTSAPPSTSSPPSTSVPMSPPPGSPTRSRPHHLLSSPPLPAFVSPAVLSLLDLLLDPSASSPLPPLAFQLPDHSDALAAGLNLLRFLLLREQQAARAGGCLREQQAAPTPTASPVTPMPPMASMEQQPSTALHTPTSLRTKPSLLRARNCWLLPLRSAALAARASLESRRQRVGGSMGGMGCGHGDEGEESGEEEDGMDGEEEGQMDQQAWVREWMGVETVLSLVARCLELVEADQGV